MTMDVTLNEQAPPAVTEVLVDRALEADGDPAADEPVDLVVVGAGISGLAAAYFYLRRFGDERRVVLLDAADHVGGMTRRVEFDVDGRQLVTFGGASGFSGTRSWSSPINRRFLADIGVDVDTMPAKGDPAIAALGAATFLDRETYGEDRVVPGAGPVVAWPAEPVTLAHLAVPARLSYLATTSYRSFLRDDWRLGADADLFTRRTIGTFGSPARVRGGARRSAGRIAGVRRDRSRRRRPVVRVDVRAARDVSRRPRDGRAARVAARAAGLRARADRQHRHGGMQGPRPAPRSTTATDAAPAASGRPTACSRPGRACSRR